jgi:ABC-type multidrug transport system fused ATPase/permease subunit
VARRAAVGAATAVLDYSGALVNYGCIAAAVFGPLGGAAWRDGDGGAGVADRVARASFYLLSLINALTSVLDLARQGAEVAGLGLRVGQLLAALGGGDGSDSSGSEGGVEPARGEKAGGDGPLCAAVVVAGATGGTSGCAAVVVAPAAAAPPPPPGLLLQPAAAPVLCVRGLSVRTPRGAPIVRGASFTLRAGGALLLAGPSGCGKSTLIRTLAGMWPADEGAIELAAPPSQVLMLPQQPLPAPGASLRAQLLYPGPAAGRAHVSDASLLQLLSAVGLAHLAGLLASGGCSAAGAQPPALSHGEAQRLAVARALLRPRALVVLDEGTSGLGEEAAAGLYALLRASGAALLSTAHGDGGALRPWHDSRLTLAGDGRGGWALEALQRCPPVEGSAAGEERAPPLREPG